MIVVRKPLELFVDVPAGTVMGYGGTYIVKMPHPVVVKEGERAYTYNAFDLQSSRLFLVPEGARGFIVKGNFVEGAKAP